MALQFGFDFTQLPNFGAMMQKNLYAWYADKEEEKLWRPLLKKIKFTKETKIMTNEQNKTNPFYGKTVVVRNPEEVFQVFNYAHPDGYKGRSMSVSDIVVFEYSNGKKAAYFCSRFGFKIVAYWKDERWEEMLHYKLSDKK